MPTVLALDQGTTGSTAVLVGDDGRVLGKGYHEFTQHFPEPGWVEHDPIEIWQTTMAAARDAVGGQIPDAIGITNQRETVVVWDRVTGRPLHRALVWQDRRTSARCAELRAERGDAFIAERTGLVWDPYFSGSKIEWLLRTVPGIRDAAERGTAVFGTIDAWLVYHLTGGDVLVTDHTNASRTLLYNINRHHWDDELLELFGVPRIALPDIRGSSEVVGATVPDLFGAAVPIAGIAGDQQAALFGQGCYAPGDAKNTYGTGAFLLMVVGDHAVPGSAGGGVLTTVACGSAGEPILALEGSVFIAGAAVQWIRDGLGLVASAAETEALARAIADTGGVYFVPAFVGLGAPYWEPAARGTIVGLTRGSGREHLVRAALEAMAYGTKDVLDAMAAASGVSLASLKVDGGASANDWLMAFQAGVLGVPVRRPDVVETTALGAAGLAGLASGVWHTAAEFATTRTYREFRPDGPPIAGGYAGWQRAVQAALFWARER
ncbi:MAG TPA: glycerol kinase GlpK [Gemmatimonadales bacterium]